MYGSKEGQRKEEEGCGSARRGRMPAVEPGQVEQTILVVRGCKVLLDE